MSNGKQYEVPTFQRDYSWSEEQWEDLWIDLEALEADEHQHYMGALVLQEVEADRFTIIDGQQRLATLSLLVIASLHCLQNLINEGVEADANRERMELIRGAFLGSKSPVTLKTSPKLMLNQANRRFYEGTLLDLRQPASISALPPAERCLWKGLEYFRKRLEGWLATSDKSGAELASFIHEIVATRLLFIQVIVEDEVGAYMVFETLNARGLELTAGDLVKNYLLSIAHRAGRGDLQQAQRQWQAIADRVEAKELSSFLRQHLNSRSALVRQERVFKSIRGMVTQPRDVFALLDELERAALLNEALEEPSHALWDELPEARDAVRHLELYRASQYKCLAFAVWRRLDHDVLTKVLRFCDVISFRYSIIGQRNPNKLEQVYNDLAVRVDSGDVTDAADIKEAMREIYVSDEEFRERFAKCAISAGGSRKKLVRYILCALEKQMHGADHDFETTSATIEHILPERPAPEWQDDFSDDLHERYVSRLGNYLLLEAKLNRKMAANRALESKRAIYVQSQYPSTQAFEWEEWTPRAIEERQAQMAKVATAVWRLP